MKEIKFEGDNYIQQFAIYFDEKNNRHFVSDIDECLERNEINPVVLFISLMETARDLCRLIDVNFEDYVNKYIELGSVDDYIEGVN